VDVDVDQGGTSEHDLEVWDSDAGLKPMRPDGYASDESMELDDLLLEGGDVEIRTAMAEMMVELEDCDPSDFEWLPPRERKKIAAKKIGMIKFHSLSCEGTYHGLKERGRHITMAPMFVQSRRAHSDAPSISMQCKTKRDSPIGGLSQRCPHLWHPHPHLAQPRHPRCRRLLYPEPYRGAHLLRPLMCSPLPHPQDPHRVPHHLYQLSICHHPHGIHQAFPRLQYCESGHLWK
jgi:hypothetical protein